MQINRVVTLLALLSVVAVVPASAQYDYGGSAGGGGGTSAGGFFIWVEGATTNARNTDNVVATEIGGTVVNPIRPSWENEFAGRLGLGYGWESGSMITLTVWSFDTELSSEGSGVFGLAIGPPIDVGSSYVGDIGGFYSETTTLEAEALDLAYEREHAPTERFRMTWSLGLRYARFLETHTAVYDETQSLLGQNTFDAYKSNEGTMFGLRSGLRGEFRFAKSFSIGGGFAFALLDGELEASSSLTPIGTANGGLPPSSSYQFDDGRSGFITDIEARVTWHSGKERFEIWLGWEQSIWDDITRDLVRNFPGTVAPLDDRDSVIFSAYKIGALVRF